MDMEDCKPVDLVGLRKNVASTSLPEFPPGMAPKMLKLVKVLNELELKLKPLISKPYHEVLTKLPPIERAKVGLMEVYTINTLFWALMRTSGENIDSTLRDDYKIEMARLKETQGRLAEIEIRAQRRPMDTRVASRMVRRSLGIRDQERGEESLQSQSHRTQNRHNGRQFPTSQSANNEYQDEGNYQYQDEGNYQDQDEGNYQDQDEGNYQDQDEGNYQDQDEGNYQDQDERNYQYQEGNYQYQDEENYQYQNEENYQYQDESNNEYQEVNNEDQEVSEYQGNNEYQDVDGNSGFQDKDVSPVQPVSPVKNKKKKKKVDSILQDSDMDYQEASYNNSGYQGSDVSPAQPVSPVKNKKKKKKVDSILQDSDMDYQEASYNNSGYQGSGEDSFLPTPPNKMRKKGKKGNKLQTSDEDDIYSASYGMLKKKKNKVSSFANTVDSISEYQNTDEDSFLPTPPNKMRKKGKKGNKLQMSEDDIPSASYGMLKEKKSKVSSFANTVDNISEYQNTGEDSFLPTPPNKMRKKGKKEVKLEPIDDDIPSTSNGMLKKKKSKVNNFANTVDNINEYQNTGKELAAPRKGKKKRKIEEEACTYLSNEDSISEITQDNQVTVPVSKKKQKKKKEAETSQSEVSDYLDTSASRISYQIEDDSDVTNKGRSWYKQAW